MEGQEMNLTQKIRQLDKDIDEICEIVNAQREINDIVTERFKIKSVYDKVISIYTILVVLAHLLIGH
jgi:hypothetical protein